MNRRLKALLLLLLILGQLLILNQYPQFRLNVDLLYLIIFYAALKMGFVKGVVTATLLGLLTDLFSMRVMGVFSFSRVMISYFVREFSRFLDLRKNIFLFIFILISLFLSNLVANLFFYFIFKFHITHQLLLLQPFFTALAGTIILLSTKVKNLLHVY